MKKAIKYLAPVVFDLSCLLCYGLVTLLFSHVSNLLDAIFATVVYGGMILAAFLVAVPAYCALYGIKILRNAKKNPLLAFYNALVLTLGYFLLFLKEDETYVYSALLFVWALLWSALPPLFSKKEKINS